MANATLKSPHRKHSAGSVRNSSAHAEISANLVFVFLPTNGGRSRFDALFPQSAKPAIDAACRAAAALESDPEGVQAVRRVVGQEALHLGHGERGAGLRVPSDDAGMTAEQEAALQHERMERWDQSACDCAWERVWQDHVAQLAGAGAFCTLVEQLLRAGPEET